MTEEELCTAVREMYSKVALFRSMKSKHCTNCKAHRRRTCEKQGLVVEPSGCAGVAAVMSGKLPAKGTVCVVTGRNMAGEELAEILSSCAEVGPEVT